MSRRLGISNYHLFWRGHVQYAGDEFNGRRLLEQFEGDLSAMNDLRGLVAESTLDIPDLNGLSDSEVVDAVLQLLQSGELLVVRHGPAHGGSPPQPDTSSSAPAGDSAPPPAAPTQRPEAPTLPPNTNGAAQAQTLANAAQSGAPFCDH